MNGGNDGVDDRVGALCAFDGRALAWRAVTVATGLRGEAKMVVGVPDTARALGSGTVEVLGTPRLVALCEEACCRAMAPVAAGGTTTVGMKVRLDHLQPSPVGATSSPRRCSPRSRAAG